MLPFCRFSPASDPIFGELGAELDPFCRTRTSDAAETDDIPAFSGALLAAFNLSPFSAFLLVGDCTIFSSPTTGLRTALFWLPDWEISCMTLMASVDEGVTLIEIYYAAIIFIPPVKFDCALVRSYYIFIPPYPLLPSTSTPLPFPLKRRHVPLF